MPRELVIKAFTTSVNCPQCDEDVCGWVGDPRGAERAECDECGHVFSIPEDTRVDLG